MTTGRQRLQFDLVDLLQFELDLIELKDLELLDALVISQILHEADCCLDRVELVVTGMSVTVLEHNHVVRH